MKIDEIKSSIARIIKTHRAVFTQIGSSQSKLLEIASITGVAEHYKSIGYKLRLVNPVGKNFFAVKTSTRGFPWNFSRIIGEKNNKCVEIHMNLMVRSAHDNGTYCVDVGICRSGIIPFKNTSKEKWVCIENEHLVTFAEAKKLVVYPMLLAQFIGQVHEIKPRFLNGKKYKKEWHPSPILISLGYFSGNAQTIVAAYKKRKISVIIAENYDIRLSKVRQGTWDTPFKDYMVTDPLPSLT